MASASWSVDEGDSATAKAGVGLLDLPRDCLVRVVLFLCAVDACVVARVCRALRAVADSDDAWAPRLLSNAIIRSPIVILSKKDLYFRLRSGILRKDFCMPYWLDPATGEGCFVKSARALSIVWGDDERYWRWAPQPDSWFPEGACLENVCWLEVRGELEAVFMPGAYTVSFRVRFTDAFHGWTRSPVNFSLSTTDGQHVESQRFLQGVQTNIESRSVRVTPLRQLGHWMELDVGEFLVESEMRLKVQFRMMEIQGGRWKRGLVLDGVKIQPSNRLLMGSSS